MQVADELLKETSVRRSSASQDAYFRTANNIDTKQGLQNSRETNASSGTLLVPNVRKFRPFTMNLMTDVSILFADIAGRFLYFLFSPVCLFSFLMRL